MTRDTATRALRRITPGLLCTLLLSCGASEPVPKAGDWRLVNYWAIWCAPCREEIPALNVIDNRAGVSVFGVNFDGVVDRQLAQQRDELDIRFPELDRDPASALGVQRPTVLPTTLLIDPAGSVTMTLVGPQTAETLINSLRESGYSPES